MGRAGIVSSKLLAEHGRWDVAHYLGNPDVLEGNVVDAAEKNLTAATARLDKARAEQEAERARVAGLEQFVKRL
jgi:hypothetical protein